jgi:hypothetical protein
VGTTGLGIAVGVGISWAADEQADSKINSNKGNIGVRDRFNTLAFLFFNDEFGVPIII